MFFSIISIILTILSITLTLLGIIKDKYYPYLIYAVALFAVYSTTIVGSGVVGSDISAEAFRSKEAFLSEWNITANSAEVTSFVVGWLVPTMSKILFIDVVWVYKVILPMIFALCPVILYLAYARQIDKQGAFLAAMFFVIMPAYSLDIATIGKSMVAETLLAIAIYALIADWRKLVKFIVILVCLSLTLWAHYSVGIMGLALFLSAATALFMAQFMRKWKLWEIQSTPWWLISICVVLTAFIGMIYFSIAGSGFIYNALVGVSHNYPELISSASNESIISGTSIANGAFFRTQGAFVRAAIGLDFNESTNYGKIFRIIQFITQFLVIVGCIYILFSYKKYKLHAEFVAGIGASISILFLCIFVPYVNSIISMTRFYNISLFFLAPTLIIGVDCLTRLICRKCR